MNVFTAILIILGLILISAVISSAEISLAGSRKMKLQALANEGNEKAKQVLALQASPGRFITVVQIGLNMVAILAGIIGESAISPFFKTLLFPLINQYWATTLASWLSFIGVTVSFVLLADLIPKRIAMTHPEKIAIKTVKIMQFCMMLFKPIVWVLDSTANAFFKIFHISTVREDNLTSEDIVALVGAGAEAGVLKQQEHYLIENIFDMQERTVTSSMTTRENIIFLDRNFSREQVLNVIHSNPHPRLLICNKNVDNILGYVETHNLLTYYLQSKDVALDNPNLLRKPLFIPDTLSLFEVLELFKSAGEEFAIIVNEYALVVGLITLKDVMSIVMGELVSNEEEQIIRRSETTWLIDGATPLEDVMRALNINKFPHDENYETIAGFMMYSLRKIPKKTDFVLYDSYKFEIIDTDNFKIDQLMVSLEPEKDNNLLEPIPVIKK